MTLLGILFPALMLLMSRPKFNWRIIFLFAEYLAVFSTFDFFLSYIEAGFALRFVFTVLAVALEASNLEHVINNDSNHCVSFIKYVFDPVFLKGSGTSKRFILRSVSLCLLAGLVSFIDLQSFFYVGLTAFATCGLKFVIAKDPNFPMWTQESWLTFNLRTILKSSPCKNHAHLPEGVEYSTLLQEKNFRYENSQRENLPEQKISCNIEKRNVLIVMVEGLGTHQIEKGWLPKLQKRASAGLTFETFISHQRNTNRGVYSILSGKHPNLVSQMAKSDLISQYGKMEDGLANVLKNNGYKTVFLQGAPKVFMSKDKFLPQMGFEEVIGEEDFSTSVPRIKWGIDDKCLYQQALNKILSLQNSSEPWFLTLLTVSTHHPYQAVDKKLSTAEEAFEYADSKLDEFLSNLKESGVLDNTLVLVTGDEVSGDSQSFLTHNLGFLSVLAPEVTNQNQTSIFGQSDIALSVTDYLNIEAPFTGRSFLRVYPNDRKIYFSNIFQQKAYCYSDKKLFVKYYSGKEEVYTLNKLSTKDLLLLSELQSFQGFNDFIEANDRDLNILSNPVLLNIHYLIPNGSEEISTCSALKVGLKKSEVLKLKFTGNNIEGNRPVVLNWTISDMKNKRSFKLNQFVVPGNSQNYEKSFTSPEDSWYDLSVKVKCADEGKWNISNLQISLESEQKVS